MLSSPDDVNRDLEKYRAYLETLTVIQVDPRLRRRFGLSDVIQQTLLEAWHDLERLRALEEPARKQRLRRMMINNLLDKIREATRAGDNVQMTVSLQEAAAESSYRLLSCLAAEDAPPEQRAVEQEEAQRLLEALARLPERERLALILQQYHGWTLAQIGEHLGCSAGAVAGLHARGLKRLREFLPHERE